MELYNLVSFLGMFVLMGIAWLFSTDRKKMNWHLIGWGLGLQILFALFIFVVPEGAKLFLVINDAVVLSLIQLLPVLDSCLVPWLSLQVLKDLLVLFSHFKHFLLSSFSHPLWRSSIF